LLQPAELNRSCISSPGTGVNGGGALRRSLVAPAALRLVRRSQCGLQSRNMKSCSSTPIAVQVVSQSPLENDLARSMFLPRMQKDFHSRPQPESAEENGLEGSKHCYHAGNRGLPVLTCGGISLAARGLEMRIIHPEEIGCANDLRGAIGLADDRIWLHQRQQIPTLTQTMAMAPQQPTVPVRPTIPMSWYWRRGGGKQPDPTTSLTIRQNPWVAMCSLIRRQIQTSFRRHRGEPGYQGRDELPIRVSDNTPVFTLHFLGRPTTPWAI